MRLTSPAARKLCDVSPHLPSMPQGCYLAPPPPRLPIPVGPSVLSFFFANSTVSTFFSPENPENISLRVKRFCMAFVEQLGDDSW